MSYMDYHLEEKLMGQRVEYEQRQADVCRLAREARKARQHWQFGLRAGIVRRFGGFLESLGRHLVDACLPQALISDERAHPD